MSKRKKIPLLDGEIYTNNGYNRLNSPISIEEFISFVKQKHPVTNQKRPNKTKTLFRNRLVKPISWRYANYSKNGVVCVCCGLTADVAFMERCSYAESNNYHFNLYHINKDGSFTMLTVDHIKPKSKQGSSNPKNLMTLCCNCNVAKSNKNYSDFAKDNPAYIQYLEKRGFKCQSR